MLIFGIWMIQCLINILHEGIASFYLVALSADFIELCVHKTCYFLGIEFPLAQKVSDFAENLHPGVNWVETAENGV